MRRKSVIAIIFSLFISGAALASPFPSGAEAASGNADGPGSTAKAVAPKRYGMSVQLGNTYDPGTDVGFLLVNGFAIYDYGDFWNQDRPPELRFKIEGSAGGLFRPDFRVVASAGITALYFLDMIAGRDVRPYVEGGIGVIYADYKVKGQGLGFNFNPQLGIGAELGRGEGMNTFAAIRLHHVSNGGLHDDNRGMNSLVLQVGRYF